MTSPAAGRRQNHKSAISTPPSHFNPPHCWTLSTTRGDGDYQVLRLGARQGEAIWRLCNIPNATVESNPQLAKEAGHCDETPREVLWQRSDCRRHWAQQGVYWQLHVYLGLHTNTFTGSPTSCCSPRSVPGQTQCQCERSIPQRRKELRAQHEHT